MSRSYRKPYFGNTSDGKYWKKMFNRVVRREEDVLDGKWYKKVNNVWCSAMEHKHGYWDVPRMRRK